ncbi:acetate--CoA ligase family protein [Pseudosulfitobacter koreensis]|uniref:Acetate--CoA ligase family protein n=1 Tax=Pseudosulfitobacter koreensis TaxID=2968472 RepID=A0ABT1Z0W2_9RHOB|nr:acetate--CoA ligase family protein [Pseudosulfitobacter koreense]MCR8826788.1 acetate--CoA ligase family protein [Pseudosulfitobacter koreense]
MTRDLSRLLRPRSIAVVGGGAWCAQVVKQTLLMGYPGAVHIVHPKGIVVEGIASVPMVEDLPQVPDAVFIGVNRHVAIDVIGRLARMGAGGAVCFASGFAEAAAEDADGLNLQAQLVVAAGKMPFLGPNCYGYVNALDGALLWPDQHGCARVERGVAILTQSSNIAINLTMQLRGLPIAYTVACGNMAQTSQAEIALGLLDDPRVTAIGLHVEGFGDTGAWHRLALRAAERGVPLIALKVGASEQAQRATVSHTASLAGGDAGAAALLKRLGIGRVRDLPTFVETLKLLHVVGPLDAPTLSSISCSGGEASLAADTAHGRGVSFPGLTQGQHGALAAALGPMVALSNPLDYNTYIWRDADAMARAWAPMAAEHIGLTLLIVDYPHTDATDWECATLAALQVRAQTGRPVAMVATLPELMPKDVAQRLIDGRVVPMNGLTEAIAAADVAAHLQLPVARPPLPPGMARGGAVLMEYEAKAALAEHGLDVPKSVTVLGKTASGLDGLTPPFAVKGLGLAHKTEAGAVLLNIAVEDVPQALADLPGTGSMIEEMVSGGVAELLVGVTRDPAHGFVLTIGAGGVLTELLEDTVSLLVPSDEIAVIQALTQLKCAALLDGYRGKPAADRDSIVDAIMAVQSYVIAQADAISEVEVNPLICTPTRAVAADALIRIAKD